MSDIVERLRDDGKLGYPPWHQPCIAVMREAADEIERLRAVLAKIRDNRTGSARYLSDLARLSLADEGSDHDR